MAGRLICTIVTFVMTAYIICIVVFFFLFQDIKENINGLNYDACEIVSTSGILSKNIYERLKYHAQRLGKYDVALKLEIQLKPGLFDTYYEEADIVDRKLHVGDRLTINIKDKDTPVFYRLLNAQILGFRPSSANELHISSIKTAVISRGAE